MKWYSSYDISSRHASDLIMVFSGKHPAALVQCPLHWLWEEKFLVSPEIQVLSYYSSRWTVSSKLSLKSKEKLLLTLLSFAVMTQHRKTEQDWVVNVPLYLWHWQCSPRVLPAQFWQLALCLGERDQLIPVLLGRCSIQRVAEKGSWELARPLHWPLAYDAVFCLLTSDILNDLRIL